MDKQKSLKLLGQLLVISTTSRIKNLGSSFEGQLVQKMVLATIGLCLVKSTAQLVELIAQLVPISRVYGRPYLFISPKN